MTAAATAAATATAENSRAARVKALGTQNDLVLNGLDAFLRAVVLLRENGADKAQFVFVRSRHLRLELPHHLLHMVRNLLAPRDDVRLEIPEMRQECPLFARCGLELGVQVTAVLFDTRTNNSGYSWFACSDFLEVLKFLF